MPPPNALKSAVAELRCLVPEILSNKLLDDEEDELRIRLEAPMAAETLGLMMLTMTRTSF
ncbi:hypothetical protein A6A04_13145 [Paramagnetospirillum marisnigri]|uniref:Uncharacterized protein n=1 Tax=Paramagnetospirillum marisnigri TaxID=1285242 RepID=A0A178MUU3_9PROT|nr:hypothetical protein A6A04_13145 [Paramagnetospirillum marisnigri]